MTKKKLGADRLDVNILVPFAGPMANKVKRISRANGMPNTMVVRMIMEIGLEEIEKGRELKLVMPNLNGEDAAA
jgi:hypothetical protein